jgi:hypothetical protein
MTGRKGEITRGDLKRKYSEKKMRRPDRWHGWGPGNAKSPGAAVMAILEGRFLRATPLSSTLQGYVGFPGTDHGRLISFSLCS